MKIFEELLYFLEFIREQIKFNYFSLELKRYRYVELKSCSQFPNLLTLPPYVKTNPVGVLSFSGGNHVLSKRVCARTTQPRCRCIARAAWSLVLSLTRTFLQ